MLKSGVALNHKGIGRAAVEEEAWVEAGLDLDGGFGEWEGRRERIVVDVEWQRFGTDWREEFVCVLREW